MIRSFAHHDIFEGLKTQYQVIRALMLRQILLRWGRNNLGYLWLFLEPLILIVAVVGFISIFRGQALEKAHFGIAIIPFLFLGYSQSMTWRFVSQKCAGAFAGNIPLFEHRFIRPFDVLLSTALVEILGVSAAFLSIYAVLYWLDLMTLPQNIPLLIYGWVLLLWFAVAFGIFFGALAGAFDFIQFVMRGVVVLFYLISGVFFAVAWLPLEYRDLVLWVPMVHGTEMLRHAYYGDRLITFENPAYLIACNCVLSVLALWISRAAWLEDVRE